MGRRHDRLQTESEILGEFPFSVPRHIFIKLDQNQALFRGQVVETVRRLHSVLQQHLIFERSN